MISREEMQEVTGSYKEPIGLNIGSHSALDAWQGQRNYGLRTVIYTTPQRARIYLENPMVGNAGERIEDLASTVRRDLIVVEDPRDIKKGGSWRSAIVIVDRYADIVKYVDDLVQLECLQIPNRAFSVYVGGDERCSLIEDRFAVPIVGSRRLLKIENRGEIERDYYWYAEKAGIPFPKSYPYDVHDGGIRFKEPIEEPMLLKAEHATRTLEREFIFAANSRDMEAKVAEELRIGNLTKSSLERARAEQIVLGPHANFNFFFSPLDAKESWGDAEKAFSKLYGLSIDDARACLSNQLLSIDERRETILDGLKRLPIDVQEKLRRTPSFEVTCHLPMSLRESLLKEVHRFADAFLLTAMRYEPPGIIGAWCLQTLITWEMIGPGTAIQFGLYDVPEGQGAYMHLPVTQDVALRHGGGTNTHMGIGAQYSNPKYGRTMSMGDRIALEIRRALKGGSLAQVVT